MSKRSVNARSSPPSPDQLPKRQKTTANGTSSSDISLIPTHGVDTDTLSLLGTQLPANHSSMFGQSLHDTRIEPSRSESFIGSVQVGSEQSEGWSRFEKRKKKKAKKEDRKFANQPPSFAFNVQELVKLCRISISDVRELALHITGDAGPVSWLRVTNRASIKRLVVMLVPGITPEVFTPPLRPQPNTSNPLLHIPALSTNPVLHPPKIPFLSTFLHAVPTKAPGDAQKMHSVLQGFFMGPVTGEEKKRRILDRIQGEKESSLSVESLLLTQEQLIENEYPLPTWMSEASQLDDSWLQTSKHDGNMSGFQILALDCEMCITTTGRELTHICIVDYKTGDKLYDQLVLPSAPIVDYLTRFSGITAASLKGVTTTFGDVHKFLSTLVKPSTILLGHSLESDLRAMRLAHGRCIDTSIIYHHPRGRPLKPGLKWLMKKWVGKDIQTRGEGGHDPEEDARACIDLLKLKFKNGLGFGHFMVDVENILERMGRSNTANGKHVRTGVVDYGTPATWLGSKATSTVACANDDDVVKGIQDMIGSHQFVFGRMLELSEGMGCTCGCGNSELSTYLYDRDDKESRS
ncbi:hypothetical protein FRC19_006014 [Serendipita sp. 401]|nr:hypothetical protein FRC19_006014 [Serendipita sp. 401]